MSPPRKFYDTDEFQKLNEKWQQKLAKTGFNDIEENEDRLKHWSHKYSLRPEQNAAKAEYFRAAGQFLHDYVFPDAYHRTVWELHTAGLSFREVVLELKKKGFKKAYRWQVQRVTWALREKMFEWRKNQSS